MKFLVVLSALCVAINALSDHAAWSDFKLTHKKGYQNKLEEQLRFQVFQDNLKRIEEHNAKYNNGEVSYYLAVNQFADMTAEEFSARMNRQIATKPKLNATLFDHTKYQVDEAIDWRDSADLTVKDQGQCGSCWAFSTTGSLEGQLLLKQKSKTLLSEQELVDCSTVNAGCEGGNMEYAFDYIRQNGLSSEEDYRYTAQDGTCKRANRAINTISGYKSVADNENALKTAVGTVGPVSIAVNADLNWQLYGGGIFDHFLCTGFSLNHGVLAVGYGRESNKDFWIIKNSWGASWGEKGYIRLHRGSNQCGVANDASYPEL